MGSKKCFKGNSMQLKILTLWYLLFFWKIHPKAFGNLYSTTLYTFGRSSVLLILHYYKAMMPPLAMPRSSLLRVQTPVDTQARCVTDTGSPPPKYDTTHYPTSGGSPLLVIQDECSHRIPPPAAPCNVHPERILVLRKRLIGEVVQSRRRPLLGPSPGWKRLLALSHLRHY